MSTPQARQRQFDSVEVTAIESLTPNLKRLQFRSAIFTDYPQAIEGGYVKFAFNADGEPYDGSAALAPEGLRLRTYSVRALDRGAGLLSVDFVLHGDGDPAHGPASAFAMNAAVGDRIAVTGPGGVKALDPAAEALVLAADLSGLPALSAKLELLQATGKALNGVMVLELGDAEDAGYINVPDGIELHTLVKSDSDQSSSALVETLQNLSWPQGRVFAWCAAEFSRMQGFRSHVRDQRGVGLEQRYVSSYWMLGRNEEGHKQAKRQDPERDQ